MGLYIVKREDFIVTIPIPCEVPRARGLWATTFLGTVIQTKVLQSERDLVEHEASAIGITKSAFMRWSAVKVAEAMRDKRLKKDAAIRQSQARSQSVDEPETA